MNFRICGVLIAGLMAAALPLAAHHSFSAEYDNQQPVRVSGVVTKVEWENPHIWFYVDVMNEDGTVTNWGVSGGSPSQLLSRGITKSTIQVGMKVNVEAFRAKDGSHNAAISRISVELSGSRIGMAVRPLG